MLILTAWLVITGLIQVSGAEAIRDTLPEPAVRDTISQDSTAIVQEPEREVPDTVYVWNYPAPHTMDQAESDSTLRWVNMVNLFDRFFEERGAITFRQGTNGRLDGLEYYALESRHMDLEMDGMVLDDPLTGAVNWNRIAYHKIEGFHDSGFGAGYRSSVRLRDYYLIEPRTYLNFDESQFDYRSLEFSFTQNFLKTTNLELSYWDRRDGGDFRRSGVTGSQVVARAYHQLNHRWLVKTGYISNGMERDESFGYVIADPELFPFNRFIASPNETSATSDYSTGDLYVQLHHRRDSTSDVSSSLGFHYQTSKWSLSYSSDTTSVKFRRGEFFARQNFKIGAADLRGTARLFMLGETEGRNLSEKSWTGGLADLNVSLPLARRMGLSGRGTYEQWSDGRSSTELSGQFTIRPISWWQLSVHGGLSNRAQDLQALYWTSVEYEGNEALENEMISAGGITSEWDLSPSLTLGIRGDLRRSQNAAFVVDSLFQTVAPYRVLSGTAWVGLDSPRLEGEVSGTIKTWQSEGSAPIDNRLNESGERIYLKSRLYWKNYLFNRATFVKAGFSGLISLNPFRTPEYIVPLNRWQHSTNALINPAYYRLDVDVSARIRWFMVLLKWENILDDINQAGYFESTGYPMPNRRFRFGIRVLFTN
ncbi:MAG: hypothetical protein GVY02_05030 [Bacteroidetes bacterium]|jgi:hypothetical protein|nr:hypothetical protein [Bacteroidota bacterium]